jgi:hypothetical protein
VQVGHSGTDVSMSAQREYRVRSLSILPPATVIEALTDDRAPAGNAERFGDRIRAWRERSRAVSAQCAAIDHSVGSRLDRWDGVQ